MQGFNHIAGGFAFTGLFCSFADVNIFDRFDTMAVVAIAAVLPDIDHTKSLIGKAVFPLAKWLQTKYGHRTITHSLFFYIAVVVLTKGADNLFHLNYALPVALALGSHLIFDMCTKQGIPLFYPFSRRPAVLPANPKLRLSANDFRSEAVIFVIFCCLNVFSFPLMAAGFWTKYNKSFATFEHLEREAKRKHGDYLARFISPTSDTISGIVVEQADSKIVVYASGEFQTYDPRKCKLINFTRQQTHHEVKAINLLQVSVDSLNFHMRKPVVKVTAQSEQELIYLQGTIVKKAIDVTIDYPNGVQFQQLAIDNAHTKAELDLLDLTYKNDRAVYADAIGKIQHMHDELEYEQKRTTGNDYDEGERRQRVKVLTEQLVQVQTPIPPNEEIYHVQRALLEMKLKENAHVNASILVWESTKDRRN